jgi:hypothetical protein
MDFNYINIHQICSLEGRFIKRNRKYEYREHQPRTGKFPRVKREVKESFYEWDCLRSIEQIESDGTSFVDGKKVFHKPFIVLKMSNQSSHRKTFNSNIEMYEFLCKSPLSKLATINTKSSLPRRSVLLEKHQGYSDEFRILLKHSLEIANL